MGLKVDIFYCSFGAGHKRAAAFVGDQLGEHEVDRVDVFEAMYPRLYKPIYATYADFIRKRNTLFRVYSSLDRNNEKVVPRLNFLRRRLFRYLDNRTLPDVFVATYSIAATLLNDYIESRALSIPLVTCITDFMPHTHWMNPETDLYLVASGYTESKLRQNYIPRNRIMRFGLAAADFKFTLRTDIKPDAAVTVSGGGLGLLPDAPTFYTTIRDKFQRPVNIVTGKNHKLTASLARMFDNDPSIRVMGYVHDMEALWRETGIFIGKAGGLSTYEAIAHGCPIFYMEPFLTQEKKNATFIDTSGIGAPLNRVLASDITPEQLLDFAAARENMFNEMFAMHPEDLSERLERVVERKRREAELADYYDRAGYRRGVAL